MKSELNTIKAGIIAGKISVDPNSTRRPDQTLLLGPAPSTGDGPAGVRQAPSGQSPRLS